MQRRLLNNKVRRERHQQGASVEGLERPQHVEERHGREPRVIVVRGPEPDDERVMRSRDEAGEAVPHQ